MGVVIFGTAIAYDVEMTMAVLDCQYDLGVKGQGETYLNLSYNSWREHGCLCFVDDDKCLLSPI